MPTLNDIREKASEATEKAISSAQRTARIADLKVRKSSVKSELEDAYMKLGQYYYELEKEEAPTDRSEEMIQLIAELKAKMQGFDDQIEQIRESANQKKSEEE